MANHTVTVYSTTTCPYCVMAKEWLSGRGVPYENKDVGTDYAAGQEMITKSGQMGVPVVDIDGQIIIGFQPEVFKKLLA